MERVAAAGTGIGQRIRDRASNGSLLAPIGVGALTGMAANGWTNAATSAARNPTIHLTPGAGLRMATLGLLAGVVAADRTGDRSIDMNNDGNLVLGAMAAGGAVEGVFARRAAPIPGRSIPFSMVHRIGGGALLGAAAGVAALIGVASTSASPK